MVMNLQERTAGVLLHITSLPGPHGIGDLGADAFRFVDWLAEGGQRIWQVLPNTPIGPGDSPYQSPSAFAGSPLMVALGPLVEKGWLKLPDPPIGGFDTNRIEFRAVEAWRHTQLREAAGVFFARAGDSVRADFSAWCGAQAHWLDDYALFMALQTLHQGLPWWEWCSNAASCTVSYACP